MSYLALARKWRPKTFADVAGQGHVVRALENALNSGKLHHAFLFTGTRGVGKTTIARIFVKALNCERAVSAEPCGECPSCVAIDQGRFIDFLEVDAASRTGIDDARELLENAQYAPAAGRFKVYLIDEVHMLSKPAFNALLKTLEEPPPHVKFLLATTDPQKIPVTVLSRCLQFNLKRLPQATILERLNQVCSSEGIPTEPGALQRLARAATGSMRDGLSLLDQAVAFGDGGLRDKDITEMLGSLDRVRVVALAEALAAADAPALMAHVLQLDELAPDYGDVLASLATLLQQVAVVQLAGTGALDAENGGEEEVALIAGLAGRMAPETVQLMYQIAVMGRRDLPFAPDPRTGFEMALLRMVAFHPERQPGAAPAVTAVSPPARAAGSVPTPSPTPGLPPRQALPPAAAPPATGQPAADMADWPAFVAGLQLDGAARQLASHCALVAQSPFEIRLVLGRKHQHLLTDNLRNRMVTALQARLGSAVKVQVTVADPTPDTPPDTLADREARGADHELQKAREQIAADPNVRAMAELFDAEVIPESIRKNPKPSSRK